MNFSPRSRRCEVTMSSKDKEVVVWLQIIGLICLVIAIGVIFGWGWGLAAFALVCLILSYLGTE